MRSFVKRKTVLLLFASFPAATTKDLCDRLLKPWSEIRSYECTYRAVTFQEGKKTESLMRYSFERPDKIRMDIESPRKGAVLIYNPEVSKKVRVRPFPGLKFFVLDYNLTDKKVSSDSGGTLDRSDLANRAKALCEDLTRHPPAYGSKNEIVLEPAGKDGGKRRVLLGDNGLIEKLEVYDGKGELSESFEWTGLKANPIFGKDLFTKF